MRRSTTDENREFNKRLGQRLRAVRNELGLPLERVAEKSGGDWPAVVVGSYERADRQITVARLAALADFYGVPVTDLLPETDAPSALTPVQRREKALRLIRHAEALLAGEVES